MGGRRKTIPPQKFGGQPPNWKKWIDFLVQNKTNQEQVNQQRRESCSTITQPQDTAMSDNLEPLRDMVDAIGPQNKTNGEEENQQRGGPCGTIPVGLTPGQTQDTAMSDDLVRLRDMIKGMAPFLQKHVIEWVDAQSNVMKTNIWKRYLFYSKRLYAAETCMYMAIDYYREKPMWEVISDLQGLIHDWKDHLPQKQIDWLLGLISSKQHDELKVIDRKYRIFKHQRQLCQQKAIENALDGRYTLMIKGKEKKINEVKKLIKNMKYGPHYINYWNGASYDEKMAIHDRYTTLKGEPGFGPIRALKRALDEFNSSQQRKLSL